MTSRPRQSGTSLLAILGPGILIAATGVGAGDLLTASMGGSSVGVNLLWAAAAGAVLKWFLNEGIARWQMATGTTLIEGWVAHFGRWVRPVFLVYLVPWTVFTAGALANACGVAGTGLLPLSDDPHTSKVIWGAAHAIGGLALVWFGGYRLFERFMSACTALMFVTVVGTALMVQPDWRAAGRGVLLPLVDVQQCRMIVETNTKWVLGLLGGVGGTVTLLSYSYWIREKGRSGAEGVRVCRIDLAVGYAMTALFGMAMVLIGSRITVSGRGDDVALALAGALADAVHPAGKWIFLFGFWGAVFTSVLGVWQSVPYLYADFLSIGPRGAAAGAAPDVSRSRVYRVALVLIALSSLPMLMLSVKKAQVAYAVVGSLFMPMLAVTLIILNNRAARVGRSMKNGVITNLVLVMTLVFFGWVGFQEAVENIRNMFK